MIFIIYIPYSAGVKVSNTLTTLEAVPGWLWNIASIIIAIFLGIWYAKRLSKQTEQNIVEKFEHCMNERVLEKNNVKQTSSSCTELVEYAKQLHGAKSNYERGLSKAVILNDLEAAESEFSTAINQQLPILYKYYFQRGNVRSLQEKYESAYEDYSEAVKLEPKQVQAWVYKASALGHLERYEEALEASEKAIELDPTNASAWSNKGSALTGLGKYQEALNAFDKAIELSPGLANSWAYKASALSGLKRYEEALEASEKAIELDPTHSKAWNNKGVILIYQGRYQEALDAFDKAIELDPKNTKFWNDKGIALGRLE